MEGIEKIMCFDKPSDNFSNSLAANLNHCTVADVCYLANMAYADGFYEGLPDAEKWCLKYAIKVADDIDGYEGMPFMRWLSDTIGKNIKIDWNKYA